jgi:glycosyltransferase involved in cell wall biosynthesis
VSGAELIVYGADDARLREAFPAHHDVLDQPNVRAGGRINDEQKTRAIPALDALVVPSVWYENSPIVIHEAFQAGVPVVCSNIGGMAELVTDGVNGLHFQVRDPVALRGVIERCVRDRTLLPRLAAGVKSPRSMQDHARLEIVPLYQSLRSDA